MACLSELASLVPDDMVACLSPKLVEYSIPLQFLCGEKAEIQARCNLLIVLNSVNKGIAHPSVFSFW